MPVKVTLNVRELSVDERLQLMEEVWETFEDSPGVPPPTDEQMEELKRRLEVHRQNPESAISLDELVSEVTAP